MNGTHQKAKSKGAEAQGETYVLRLFKANDEQNSKQAMENLEKLRQNYLKGLDKIEIVDVLEDYETALEHNVLITPCLILESRSETENQRSLEAVHQAASAVYIHINSAFLLAEARYPVFGNRDVITLLIDSLLKLRYPYFFCRFCSWRI